MTVNAAPFSFFNVVSSDPAIVSIAVQRADGEQKDTARNAAFTKELNIHIVGESFVEEMNKTAARLAPDVSEIDKTSLHLEQVPGMKTPKISEANIVLTAKLEQIIPIKNDAGEVVSDLILARILTYDFADEVFDSEHHYILPEKLAPVARLAGNDYTKLSDIFRIERPN